MLYRVFKYSKIKRVKVKTMKRFNIKIENNNTIINANVFAFSKKGAIKKVYKKYC